MKVERIEGGNAVSVVFCLTVKVFIFWFTRMDYNMRASYQSVYTRWRMYLLRSVI